MCIRDSYQRDRRVRAWVKASGVPMSEVPQYGVVRRLKDRDGWAKQCASRMNQPIVAAPQQIQLPPEIQSLQPGEIQTRESFQVHAFDRTSVQSGGESLANQCLDSFLNSRGVNYRADMSSPLTGEAGCSRLSPYIAIGNISMRTIHQHLSTRVAELKDCLLYTSPSPRDRQKSRMPSSA